jgi:hypothetical protein
LVLKTEQNPSLHENVKEFYNILRDDNDEPQESRTALSDEMHALHNVTQFDLEKLWRNEGFKNPQATSLFFSDLASCAQKVEGLDVLQYVIVICLNFSVFI